MSWLQALCKTKNLNAKIFCVFSCTTTMLGCYTTTIVLLQLTILLRFVLFMYSNAFTVLSLVFLMVAILSYWWGELPKEFTLLRFNKQQSFVNTGEPGQQKGYTFPSSRGFFSGQTKLIPYPERVGKASKQGEAFSVLEIPSVARAASLAVPPSLASLSQFFPLSSSQRCSDKASKPSPASTAEEQRNKKEFEAHSQQVGFCATRGHKQVGIIAMYSANATLTLLLVDRWIVSGHFPLSNLFESLIFLGWSFTTIFSLSTLQQTLLPGLGFIVAPITLLTCGFALFCVPTELQRAQPLVPALQSNWLIMHVSVMILSYASLLLGSLLALAFFITKHQRLGFLFQSFVNEKNKGSTPGTLYPVQPTETNQGLRQSFSVKPNNELVQNQAFMPTSTLPSTLDNASYRFIGAGFVLLTLGIISGAVWANFAWGSYWSWDPKETWALISWLTYAIYLHLRITKGWYGTRSATVAILGFFVVWFCYLGVNLFGKGLHSYAFVS